MRDDMPLTRASIHRSHNTTASKPNVRMPNQSRKAEKPRFSEIDLERTDERERHQQRQQR